MTYRMGVLEAELEYAEKMVKQGFATPEQAAHICGVKLVDLKKRLAQSTQSSAASALPDGISFFP